MAGERREKRILYIDPGGEEPEVQNAIRSYLGRFTQGGVSVDVASLGGAPFTLEYYLYLSLIGPDLLRMVKRAEEDGYDAVVIGCFCDPALDAAKEICEKTVVVGVMEAAVNIASLLAPRFSIIAPRRKSVQDFRDNLCRYGLEGRLASFRSLDLAVTDLMMDGEATERAIQREISTAINEDGAEAILLGCTLQLGHFEKLQEKFSVPVIDAALAGFATALHLIYLRNNFGWYTSKKCTYETPPKGQLFAWGLEEKYNIKGF